jgi:hypothetical protein
MISFIDICGIVDHHCRFLSINDQGGRNERSDPISKFGQGIYVALLTGAADSSVITFRIVKVL